MFFLLLMLVLIVFGSVWFEFSLFSYVHTRLNCLFSLSFANFDILSFSFIFSLSFCFGFESTLTDESNVKCESIDQNVFFSFHKLNLNLPFAKCLTTDLFSLFTGTYTHCWVRHLSFQKFSVWMLLFI